MRLAAGLLWTIIGFISALIVFKTQQWSVLKLNPDKKSKSTILILGCALLRWVLIATILILASFQSVYAVLTFFVAFFSTRSLLLIMFAKIQSKNNLLN